MTTPTDSVGVHGVVDSVVQRWSRIDVLVDNAGLSVTTRDMLFVATLPQPATAGLLTMFPTRQRDWGEEVE